MEQGIKKRILLLITNSYAATNVIHSGLIKSLSEKYDVYILSNFIKEKELDDISQHFNIKLFSVSLSIPAESAVIKFLRRIEKAIFFHFFRIETQEIKNAGKGIFYKLFINSLLDLVRFSGLSRSLLQLLRNRIIRLSINRKAIKELKAFGFSGVISSSPLDIRENGIVNALNQENIPSLAMIISWDNLTSKGIINANHDYILVWNQIMANEYTRYYKIFNIPNQKICITGIPRFDIYFKIPPAHNAEFLFRRKYQVHQEDKIILFATSAISHFPSQTDIVGHLLEYASGQTNAKIIVRCHPGDNLELYGRFLNEPNLKITKPDNRTDAASHVEFLPDLSALDQLYTMLKYCDLCIQVASTIRIEAAACRKPIISIAYDGNLSCVYSHSVRRFYNYSHQIPLNSLGIDQMVYSKQDLFRAINNILNDPASHSGDVHKIKELTYYTAPQAVPATMKCIQQWLN